MRRPVLRGVLLTWALLAVTWLAAISFPPARAQTPQTPQQTIEQIRGLLDKLQSQLAPPVPTGTLVRDASALTAALRVGGATLAPATTYTGNFVISVNGSTLSGPATAILAPLDPLAPTLRVTASDVQVKGLSVFNGQPDRDAIEVGTNAAKTAEANPSRVTFDGVLVQAGQSGGHRGFSLHGSHITVTNSRVVNFWEVGRDSQGIWGNNGWGPYTITNNLIEASGENILFGGADPGIVGVIPSDITIRGNTLFKPEGWREKKGSVKNSLELKNARRVLIEDNVIDGNWKDAQDGATILLTVRNQGGGCPTCIVDQVTLRRNVVKRASDGPCISILGRDTNAASGQTQTVTIERLLCQDAPSGIRVAGGVLSKLSVTNNTFPAIRGSILQFTGAGLTPLTFRANVATSGNYGIAGDATIGQAALDKHTIAVDFSGNIIEKSAARAISYPAGNTLLAPGGLKALLDSTFKLLSGAAGY